MGSNNYGVRVKDVVRVGGILQRWDFSKECQLLKEGAMETGDFAERATELRLRYAGQWTSRFKDATYSLSEKMCRCSEALNHGTAHNPACELVKNLITVVQGVGESINNNPFPIPDDVDEDDPILQEVPYCHGWTNFPTPNKKIVKRIALDAIRLYVDYFDPSFFQSDRTDRETQQEAWCDVVELACENFYSSEKSES